MRHLLAIVSLCLLLAGCVTAVPPSAAQPGRVLLLGEIHDNPAGHARRLQRLQAEIEAGWRPALVMEQFDRERAADLAGAMATCTTPGCVIAAAGGDGWDWPVYEPVLALALRHRLPVLAGNVSRSESMRVMREGLARVLPDVHADYLPSGDLPALIVRGQEAAIIEGHCGVSPRSGVAGLVRVQVARDLWMARQLRAHADSGAVLLAGNGHVRRDIGVPYWLQRHADITVQVVGISEAEPGAASEAMYDAVDEVPAPVRDDLCRLFRKPAGHE